MEEGHEASTIHPHRSQDTCSTPLDDDIESQPAAILNEERYLQSSALLDEGGGIEIIPPKGVGNHEPPPYPPSGELEGPTPSKAITPSTSRFDRYKSEALSLPKTIDGGGDERGDTRATTRGDSAANSITTAGANSEAPATTTTSTHTDSTSSSSSITYLTRTHSVPRDGGVYSPCPISEHPPRVRRETSRKGTLPRPIFGEFESSTAPPPSPPLLPTSASSRPSPGQTTRAEEATIRTDVPGMEGSFLANSSSRIKLKAGGSSAYAGNKPLSREKLYDIIEEYLKNQYLNAPSESLFSNINKKRMNPYAMTLEDGTVIDFSLSPEDAGVHTLPKDWWEKVDLACKERCTGRELVAVIDDSVANFKAYLESYRKKREKGG